MAARKWNWRDFADYVIEGALIGAVTEFMSGRPLGGRVVLGFAVAAAIGYTYRWIRGRSE